MSSSIIIAKGEMLKNYTQSFHCLYLGVTHPFLITSEPELVYKGTGKQSGMNRIFGEHYEFFNIRDFGKRKIIFLEWIPDLLELFGQTMETHMYFWKLCRMIYKIMCFLCGGWWYRVVVQSGSEAYLCLCPDIKWLCVLG